MHNLGLGAGRGGLCPLGIPWTGSFTAPSLSFFVRAEIRISPGHRVFVMCGWNVKMLCKLSPITLMFIVIASGSQRRCYNELQLQEGSAAAPRMGVSRAERGPLDTQGHDDDEDPVARASAHRFPPTLKFPSPCTPAVCNLPAPSAPTSSTLLMLTALLCWHFQSSSVCFTCGCSGSVLLLLQV